MPQHPAAEHERVAEVIRQIGDMDNVVVQSAETDANYEDFTECEVRFVLKRGD